VENIRFWKEEWKERIRINGSEKESKNKAKKQQSKD
jgi:hypothetical protein